MLESMDGLGRDARRRLHREADRLQREAERRANTGKLTGMAKRGYSREFTPQTDRRVRFEVDRIPPTLYEAVKAKAKREGVSLRALTLGLWKAWAEAQDAAK